MLTGRTRRGGGAPRGMGLHPCEADHLGYGLVHDEVSVIAASQGLASHLDSTVTPTCPAGRGRLP